MAAMSSSTARGAGSSYQGLPPNVTAADSGTADAPADAADAAAADAAANHHGRRMAERRVLGTLLPKDSIIRVRHARGTGPGRHAMQREFDGKPFPVRRSCVAAFEVQFERNFEWGCRGKIGGLKVGPGQADGGVHSWNGASLRVMWDGGGGAYAYVYVPAGSQHRQPAPLNEREKVGTDVFKADFRTAFLGTGWHRVEIGLLLNTFSKGKPNADGKLVFSVNGKTRTLNKIIWAMAPEHLVSSFVLGVFHGGGCRATRTSRSNYRNIRLYSWT